MPTTLSGKGEAGVWGPALSPPKHINHSPSPALKSSPSKKGRGALLAVKPLGPTAAFSASQIPSEREDAQYDLRGARSYPTLEDEGDWAVEEGIFVTREMRQLLGKDTIPRGFWGGVPGATIAIQYEDRDPRSWAKPEWEESPSTSTSAATWGVGVAGMRPRKTCREN